MLSYIHATLQFHATWEAMAFVAPGLGLGTYSTNTHLLEDFSNGSALCKMKMVSPFYRWSLRPDWFTYNINSEFVSLGRCPINLGFFKFWIPNLSWLFPICFILECWHLESKMSTSRDSWMISGYQHPERRMSMTFQYNSSWDDSDLKMLRTWEKIYIGKTTFSFQDVVIARWSSSDVVSWVYDVVILQKIITGSQHQQVGLHFQSFNRTRNAIQRWKALVLCDVLGLWSTAAAGFLDRGKICHE